MLKYLWRVLMAVAFAVACIACSPSESRVESGNRLGILHVGNSTEPKTIDPHVATGMPENRIILSLFEGLVTKNPYTLAIEPAVAERWSISEDQRVYTFHLRPTAKWSNGEPLTAEDFRWSWMRALHPEFANPYAYMLFPVLNAASFNSGALSNFDEVGVAVINPHTLQVTLANPTPYFLQVMDHHSSYAVHRATVEQHGSPFDRYSKWTRPENFVGNGAFVLDEWQIYRQITVKKNDQYWDASQVKLNKIVFYPTENQVTEERMFRAGQLHKTETLPLAKIPHYQQSQAKEFRSEPFFATYYYQLNTTRKPLDDVRVRSALGLAINRKLIANNVLYGSVAPSASMVPPGALGYEPPSVLGFEPERARQLLAEAGFANGEGFPTLELLYNTSDAHRKIAVAIQQMWKQELNIEVTIVNQEWKVYLQSRNQQDYDIARAGWVGDVIDPINFLELGFSGNGNNSTGYHSEDYDNYIVELIPQSKTPQQRLQRFYEAETMLLQDAPFIPIYTYKYKYLISPHVQGMPTNVMDYVNYKYVWLEQ